MKQQRIMMLLLLLSLGTSMNLAACKPGHLGSTIIAFIRGGHLWTIDPDGANSFEIVAQETPVIGYNWSPTHQVLAFRTLDRDFAQSAAGKHLTHHQITGLIQDTPGTANTIGIDGGTPIPIAFSNPATPYSNAMWTSNGSRLLYRQTKSGQINNPIGNTWWISQNDQPGGIAVKALPDSYSIPSLSYNTANYLALSNSEQAVFTTTLAGTQQHILIPEHLAGHPLTASLERILWQPNQQDQRFLYAVADSSTNIQQSGSSTQTVQLLIRTISGQITQIATCQCTQFAWSPDGKAVIYSSTSHSTIVNVADRSTFSFTQEPDSAIYWSPNSKFLVIDGLHTLTLVNMAKKQTQSLLTDTMPLSKVGVPLPATAALLQPAANSLWATDSQHFLFSTHNRLQWQGKHIGKGLYTVTIDNDGHWAKEPALVDAGENTQAGWSYQDPNTSFLYETT